jgi:hypothetical protein
VLLLLLSSYSLAALFNIYYDAAFFSESDFFSAVAGTAVQSVNKYLFGYFRVGLKLVPNDSAGVLTAFYVSISQSLVIPQLLFHNSIDCNDQYL